MATSTVTWTITTAGSPDGYLHVAGSSHVYNGDPRIRQQPAIQSSGGFVDRTSCFPMVLPGLVESARKISERPDHPFNPMLDSDGRPYYDFAMDHRLFCQDCAAGSIYMDDPGAHLYVIHEWELG